MKLSKKLIAVPAIALAAGLGVDACGSSSALSHPAPSAVKVLPQTEGPRNLGTAGPAQLNGSPANLRKLATQHATPTAVYSGPPQLAPQTVTPSYLNGLEVPCATV